LDLGTGTGRLPLLFGDQVQSLIGLDLHGDMLRAHQLQCQQVKGAWHLTQGDMRTLPIPTQWADVVTAGWAIGHLTGWYPADWQRQIGQVVDEMHRVVRKPGYLLIFETLTTGSLTPAPPNEILSHYYNWLEEQHGFTRQIIQTDYQFSTVEQAITHTEFFFGAELAKLIRDNGWVRLPEWTGLWWKQVTP
ncbi:MAG: class I SAM-dependent methyltransferase, partial [Chloroflexota bacterium]